MNSPSVFPSSFLPINLRILPILGPLLLFLLLSTHLFSASPNFSLQGWAATGKGTTGGAGGQVVTVTTPGQLVHYLGRTEPLIIQIDRMIDLGVNNFTGYKSNGMYFIESNKTIVGLGANAGIRRGELRMAWAENIIIRNLTFRDSPGTALAITWGTTNVWIDHNDFANAFDGLIDITRASDLITVSWNRFSNHGKTSLVGASDGATNERGFNRVTYHHNWFLGTNERHPRVRFGRVHVFNNFYDAVNVGIAIGTEAKIVSERNYFTAEVRSPYHHRNDTSPGFFKDFGSIFLGGNAAGWYFDDSGIDWFPTNHYHYTLHIAADIPSLVKTYSGVGIVDPLSPPNNPGPTPPPAVSSVGLVAQYNFTEATGSIAYDTSGFGSPVNLVLSNGASWLTGGGVTLDGAAAKLESNGPASKLADQISQTGQFSLEVWAKATQTDQAGPARIVGYAGGLSQRNFLLGHGASHDPNPDLIFRVRTTDHNEQVWAGQLITPELTHYVITFDGQNLRTYRNSELMNTSPRPGELTNWNRDFPLVLGNETTGDRGWAGQIYGVAIFDQPLTQATVDERYQTTRPDVPALLTTYIAWLESYYPGIDLTNTKLSSPAADPTGSGVPNLLRYALGIAADNQATHEVAYYRDPATNQKHLVVSYNRRSGITDVNILIESSDDLLEWLLLGDENVLSVVPEGGLERITVRDNVSVDDKNKRFMRIRIKMSKNL